MCLIFAMSGSVAISAMGKQASIGQIMFYDILCILWTSSEQCLLDSKLNKMKNLLMIM